MFLKSINLPYEDTTSLYDNRFAFLLHLNFYKNIFYCFYKHFSADFLCCVYSFTHFLNFKKIWKKRKNCVHH